MASRVWDIIIDVMYLLSSSVSQTGGQRAMPVPLLNALPTATALWLRQLGCGCLGPADRSFVEAPPGLGKPAGSASGLTSLSGTIAYFPGVLPPKNNRRAPLT